MSKKAIMDTKKVSELLTSIDQVMPLINDIKQKSFPELNDIKIILGSVKSDSVFLESRPIIYSLFLPFKVRYKITINPKLFNMELPLFALEGILAHELAHTAYYVSQGRMATIMTGLVFLNHSKHIDFERRTDIDAITRGYGEGIKAYREIIYHELTDEQRIIKNQRYLSVDEIDELIVAYRNYPELKEFWLEKPPLNIADIRRDVNHTIARRKTDDLSNIT